MAACQDESRILKCGWCMQVLAPDIESAGNFWFGQVPGADQSQDHNRTSNPAGVFAFNVRMQVCSMSYRLWDTATKSLHGCSEVPFVFVCNLTASRLHIHPKLRCLYCVFLLRQCLQLKIN